MVRLKADQNRQFAAAVRAALARGCTLQDALLAGCAAVPVLGGSSLVALRRRFFRHRSREEKTESKVDKMRRLVPEIERLRAAGAAWSDLMPWLSQRLGVPIADDKGARAVQKLFRRAVAKEGCHESQR
jgi:hypothetical protein